MLNLGSGGNSYSLDPEQQIHVDVAIRRLQSLRRNVVATIDDLPFATGEVDLIVCVGGVLNYANPGLAVREMCRTLKPGAYIILEFESSKSLEFSFRRVFGRPHAKVKTFYNGQPEEIQVYSEEFIVSLLEAGGARVLRRRNFHVLSSLALRLSKDERTASKWAAFDRLAQFIPGLRACGSNIILLAQKD